MSFLDIIKNEAKKLEEAQGGNNDKVKYPETKHKRLYFEKGQREIYLQVLPSADLYSTFAVPVRKVFLQTKSSQGKDINATFYLDAEPNPGSLLEKKIVEWAEKKMIPNGFGGQTTPRTVFLVNAVKVVKDPTNPQQFIQERDSQGNLVVRLFEMPQSAYRNLITKLQDPLSNPSGSELSFMDVNKPALVKISKPAKGQMEYPVDVYSSIILPPLPQGWENELEDLQEHATPTERLENGYQWVQAFVDMKEGRKPNQRNNEGDQQPQENPYSVNPFGQNANPNSIPNHNPSTGVQTQAFGQTPGEMVNSNPIPNPTPTPTPQDIGTPMEIDVDGQLSNLQPNVGEGQPVNPNPTPSPTPTSSPEVPEINVPEDNTQNQTAPEMPTHSVNPNGLMDIDAMLEKELNGGN